MEAQGTCGNSPNKIELQMYLGIINYLSKFSPSAANVCEPLQKLTSDKTLWTLNVSYQTLFNKLKSLIKYNVCMKFYDGTRPLYLETNTSWIALGSTLLQTRDGAIYPRDIAGY